LRPSDVTIKKYSAAGSSLERSEGTHYYDFSVWLNCQLILAWRADDGARIERQIQFA